MKRYNAVNNKWLLFGLVIPILLFFLSYNAVFAYFTATAGEKQASTQTAIVKIGFKADENGNYATHEVISSSATNNASNLVPGDTLKANATVINTGNVNVYCIINFKLSVTKKSSTDEEIIANDFYTFTSVGGQLVTPLTLKDTYTTEAACLIAPNAEVSLNVQTEFAGATYGNDYVGADVKYTYTAYAIQTSGLTPASAISEILTSLLNGGNRITKIGGNSVQNGTPTPESPVEIQSVGEKTKNLVNITDSSDWEPAGSNPILSCTKNTISAQSHNYAMGHAMFKDRFKAGTYSISGTVSVGLTRIIVKCYNENGELITGGTVDRWTYNTYYNGWNFVGYNRELNEVINIPATVKYWTFGLVFYDVDGSDAICTWTNVQIEEGSTATEYEPYGYKIPVEINGKTTNIYLDEPLRKVGEYADYIDVENKKVVRNVRNIKLNVSDMNNNEEYPGWAGITTILQDYPNKNNGMQTFTSQINNFSSEKSVGVNTLRSGAIFFTATVWGLNQTQWKETYPDLVFDLNYGLATSYTEDIDLPEIFDEPITEYSILTTIQPEVTIKYTLG